MEEDEERRELLDKIVGLLLEAGYFRARISSLSPFDKLTGGLAWCITASNADIDFDILFYDDDATLGDKITVGEAIEAALMNMACPYPLQAHQIQGLDYQAVYPVIQWLVKRVLQMREELGEELRRFSHLQFEENYQLPEEAASKQALQEGMKGLRSTSPLQQVNRLYRRSMTSAIPEDKTDRIHCTLLEYGLDTTNRGQTVGTCLEEIQYSLSNYIHHREDNITWKKQGTILIEKIKEQEACIKNYKDELSQAQKSLETLEQNMKDQDQKNGWVQNELDHLNQNIDKKGAMLIVERVISLLHELKHLEKKESDFRVHCKQRRAEMQAEIAQLSSQTLKSDEIEDYPTKFENSLKVDSLKLEALRAELAKKHRAVALLQRRLDDIPSQTELVQYERRFVELYENIQAKLRETRRYYGMYNALAEGSELTLKEISLLNSINSQFEGAIMSTLGRAKLLDSMEGIAKGIQQKLAKMQVRDQEEQSTYNALKEKHGAAIAEQRHYYSLVKSFQDECARNERLRAALNDMNANVTGS